MSVYSYLTIKGPSQGMYKEKGSKFMAFAYPVQSDQEIKVKIEKLQKEYFDARHHCYAWVLGPDKKHYRMFDDGEPNHSAGDPILGQIRSKNLTNVLVVVVRYFGGVKLGVGGLIQAYRMAAEEALSKSVIIEMNVKEKFTINFDYNTTAEVMRIVKDFELTIVSQSFTNECVMEIEVMRKNKTSLLEKVDLLKALQFNIQITECANNHRN